MLFAVASVRAQDCIERFWELRSAIWARLEGVAQEISLRTKCITKRLGNRRLISFEFSNHDYGLDSGVARSDCLDLSRWVRLASRRHCLAMTSINDLESDTPAPAPIARLARSSRYLGRPRAKPKASILKVTWDNRKDFISSSGSPGHGIIQPS